MISYNVYWIFVMAAFITMRYKETKGHYPFMKPRKAKAASIGETESRSSDMAATAASEKVPIEKTATKGLA